MKPFSLSLAGSLAVLALTAASCNCGGDKNGAAGPACTTAADCGGTQVCLGSQVCAAACSSDAQCLPTEKCSTGGGCVSSTQCGADGDCSGGKVCGTGGACEPSCVTVGCADGLRCGLDGHCAPPPNEGPPGSDGGMPGCGGQLFSARHSQANLLIVLDRSGSMTETIGTSGKSKWDIATGAINALVTQANVNVRYGLEVFPGSGACEVGSVTVPIGDNQGPTIAMSLTSVIKPNGRTPLAASVHLAQSVPTLKDPARGNYVMLITDGRETCDGEPIGEVEALANMGVKTYPVGFGADVDPDTLSQMAFYGGTSRGTSPQYYQADDEASLKAAIDAIALGVLGCDFTLDTPPPDPTKIFVYVDGKLIARDLSNGWDYSVNTGRVTLYGATCNAVTANTQLKVSIVYGCPDDDIGDEGGHGTRDAGTADDGGTIN